jgi:hypothetical protein
MLQDQHFDRILYRRNPAADTAALRAQAIGAGEAFDVVWRRHGAKKSIAAAILTTVCSIASVMPQVQHNKLLEISSSRKSGCR